MCRWRMWWSGSRLICAENSLISEPAQTAPTGLGGAQEVKGRWAEPIEGVQMRVRPERQTWYEGEMPKFIVDTRNKGTVELQLGLEQGSWEVELDGIWYRAGTLFTGLVPSLRLGPDQEHKDIEFSAEERSDWNIHGKPLKFTPGWHTVRLAIWLSTRDRAYPRHMRVVSRPASGSVVETPMVGGDCTTAGDFKDAAKQVLENLGIAKPKAKKAPTTIQTDDEIVTQVHEWAGDKLKVLALLKALRAEGFTVTPPVDATAAMTVKKVSAPRKRKATKKVATV